MSADKGVESLLALYQQGQFAEVIREGRKLATRHPKVLMIPNVVGAAYVATRDYAGAERAFKAAIAIDGRHAELHNNLGAALMSQGKLAEAITAYEHALSLTPDHASAHYNLGNVQRRLHAVPAAIACYRQAIALDPRYVQAHNNLGLTLQHAGRPEEAIQSYRTALDIDPTHANTLHNMATALMDIERHDLAVKAFETSLAIKPDNPVGRAQMAFCQMQLCDFSASRVPVKSEDIEGAGPIPPFIMLAFADDPAQQLAYSRAWAGAGRKRVPTPLPKREKRERIRLGYFSADFHDHATLCLMAGLLREHDRQKFEIFAYSYGVDRDDAARGQVIGGVDHFLDVRNLSDAEIIEVARGHGLDIAVDLKGYTEHSRSQIFGDRLAPVQINYLGYPGSLGFETMDYLVADAVVVPEDLRPFYSEKIITLPGSYQPNDDRRPIAPLTTSRADAGLPKDGLVLCCFNQNYKISTEEFDIWMKVLRQVDRSVLWLLGSTEAAEANLRREAAARGVDPDRLVFARRLSHAEHLARLQLADLFVDTFAVNAHTTASDALWAGLPVVTKAGRQFAARVGASLVRAVGLPELVVDTSEAYEALILDLAADPARLKAIRAQLRDKRLGSALFDTGRYTRNLESAFIAAHERRLANKAPDHITVD